MDTLKLFMAIPGKVISFRWVSMVSSPGSVVTQVRTRLSTGFAFMKYLVRRFSMESFWPSPSISSFLPKVRKDALDRTFLVELLAR